MIAAPVANFTAGPRAGTAPLTVRFTDLSSGTPVSWRWNFGDNSSVNATQKNPVHAYAVGGSYTVSLNATNSAGFNRTTKIGYISVTEPQPVLSAIVPVSGTRGRLVTITNLSGTGFISGARVSLNRTGWPLITATNVTVLSTKKITCTFPVPASAPLGYRNVDVRNPGGKLGSMANSFMVRAAVAPTVTALLPQTAGRGAFVTISNLSGTGFVGTPKPTVQLSRGSAVITGTNVTVVNAGKITCTFRIPALAATGAWNASVINGDNQRGTKLSAFTVTP